MNELNRKSSMRIGSVSPGGARSTRSNQGDRQILQQAGKKLSEDIDGESTAVPEIRLEEALRKLQLQASRAGIELSFEFEQDVFGEVVTVIDSAENLVVRRIPVAELLQQLDRQVRQPRKNDGNGLLINGTA